MSGELRVWEIEKSHVGFGPTPGAFLDPYDRSKGAGFRKFWNVQQVLSADRLDDNMCLTCGSGVRVVRYSGVWFRTWRLTNVCERDTHNANNFVTSVRRPSIHRPPRGTTPTIGGYQNCPHRVAHDLKASTRTGAPPPPGTSLRHPLCPHAHKDGNSSDYY